MFPCHCIQKLFIQKAVQLARGCQKVMWGEGANRDGTLELQTFIGRKASAKRVHPTLFFRLSALFNGDR